MLSGKELGHVALAAITLTIVVIFKDTILSGINYDLIGITALFVTFIILVNLLAKKAMAHRYEATLETRIWNWQRFGFKRQEYLKTPIPMGIIFPITASLISQGNALILTTLESKVEGTSARSAKRHGQFRFTEMTDSHIAFIIGMGVLANLALAIVAYFIDLSELARLSVFFAAYSLIPFGNLDGTKIFFGNKTYWFALVIITLIFLFFQFIPR